MRIIVIGGGAAGFFAALAAKEKNPTAEVLLLERTAKLLSKVRISGGGRCNVTHSCFDPKLLVKNYPRGSRELLGPFNRFQPRDTIDWFKQRNVPLKTEKDGRMFPITDSSSTIIHCLMGEAEKLGVEIRTLTKIKEITKNNGKFLIQIEPDQTLTADKLILATGSAPFGWQCAASLGHTTQSPVPSLFTLNIPSFSLAHLAGIAIDPAKVTLDQFEQIGPLLITHWGLSGPAALKLSAFAARHLAERKYNATLTIDWMPDVKESLIRSQLESERELNPKKQIGNFRLDSIPKNLWRFFCESNQLDTLLPFSSLGNKKINSLCESLKRSKFTMNGKTTHKEEFVTCGGITLSEVDFKTMESRKCEGLYFCGEILDIDGITGGFNFQNAWTTGWIAGNAAVENKEL